MVVGGFNTIASSLLKIVSILLIINTCQGAADSWMCSPTTDRHVINKNDCDTEDRIKALENQVRQLQKLIQGQTYKGFTTIEGFPTDCEEIYSNGTKTDGMYAISPDGRCPFFVYCDMTNGGWTVIQRRNDGGTSFYQKWDEYVTGFGDIDGSHWLGLEKIHRLTRDGTQIYFDIENYDSSRDFAHYKVFTVHEAVTGYKMNVDPFGVSTYLTVFAALTKVINGVFFVSVLNLDRDISVAVNFKIAGRQGEVSVQNSKQNRIKPTLERELKRELYDSTNSTMFSDSLQAMKHDMGKLFCNVTITEEMDMIKWYYYVLEYITRLEDIADDRKKQ